MNLIVQKYGGTSIGNAERMISVADIVSSFLPTHNVVVVLSAISSYKKSEGTTSKLLQAAREVLIPDSTEYIKIVDSIENDHIAVVQEAISDFQLQQETIFDVKSECTKLRSFMQAAEIIDELSPRSIDIIISVGEKLSARIFTSVLRSRGVDSLFINLEKLISKPVTEKTLDQSFYDDIVDRLAALLRKAGFPFVNNVVPVITGYFGPVPGSILNTIGRGYTDLTAAMVSVALRAKEFQIWKEIDGIFTADPRKVPSARLLSAITPEEAAELTYYGSEVIHPFTMEQVIRASIPIRIKNAFNPNGYGTLILPKGYREEDHDVVGPATSAVSSPSNEALQSLKGGSTKHPTAVTIKDNVTVLNVHSNKKSVSHGFLSHIFQTLDQFGIVVDLISTSEVHISMALSPNVTDELLEEAIFTLRKRGTVSVIKSMAILSLVGSQMRHLVGMASKMFLVLAQNGVNIEMISQGASEINISCVIDQAKCETALLAVHDFCIVDSINGLLDREVEIARGDG